MKIKFAWDFKKTQLNRVKGEAAEVTNNIEEFEKNMLQLGIGHSGEENTKKKKNNLQAEAAFTMARIKTNKANNHLAAKQRKIRLEQLRGEEAKTRELEEHKATAGRLGTALKRVLFKTWHSSFASLKRQLKAIKQAENSQMAVEDYFTQRLNKWKPIEEERLIRVQQDERARQSTLPELRLAINKRIIEFTKQTRQKHSQTCEPVTSLILEVLESAHTFLSTNSKIPETLWNEWMDSFSKGHPPGGLEEESIIEEATEGTDELEEPTAIEQHSVENYLDSQQRWQLSEVPNDSYLADVVSTVLDLAYPVPAAPEQPPGPHYLPLKLCILGPPFSGKSTQSKKLQEVFGLKLYEMSTILEDAQKVLDKKEDDTKKKRGQEEESALFIEACGQVSQLDATERAQLFRAKIRGQLGDQPLLEEDTAKKNNKKDDAKGLCLVNYPNTTTEAAALEHALNAFTHPSLLAEPLASIKKREAEILASPSVQEESEPVLSPSFFDLVIWIDLELDIVLQRALERRVDPAGNIYNLVFNPPPEHLLAKCKPIENPTQEGLEALYQEFEAQKSALYA